jgi:hypothetical protein
MGGVVKKLIVLAGIFLLFDRFMYYKIDRARRYARIEFLKRKKIDRKKGLSEKRLAHSKKAGKVITAQVSKCCSATSQEGTQLLIKS